MVGSGSDNTGFTFKSPRATPVREESSLRELGFLVKQTDKLSITTIFRALSTIYSVFLLLLASGVWRTKATT